MNWQGKNVLVTGGAGLIGSRIVRKLIKRGAIVTVLDDFSAYPFNQARHFLADSMNDVSVVKGSVTDLSKVKLALKDVDIVFHEAAFADVAACVWYPEKDFETNVIGTFNLLSCSLSEGVDRFIFASSASVYGDPFKNESVEKRVFSEEQGVAPLSTYANSKVWGENETLLFHELYGLKTTSLRYFSVYGVPQVSKQGSHSWVVSIFCMKLKKRKPFKIYGNGNQTRDFIHVEDVAEASIVAAEKESTIGRALNVGTGKPTTIKDLALLIQRVSREEIAIRFGPRPKGDPVGGYADVSLMKSCTNWKPRVTLKEGILEYLEWLDENPDVIPEWI